MDNTLLTVIIAAILVALALGGLAIGLLLTGKSRLRHGGCGHVPKSKPGEPCDKEKPCPICHADDKSDSKH